MGHLVEDCEVKSTTVRSYVSAIKSVLKDDGIDVNEDKYLLSSLTRACRMVNDRVYTRLPIQRGLLNVMLDKIEVLYLIRDNQSYLCTLYKALFSTTYFGLFRVSEVTTGPHPIKACGVHIGENKHKVLFKLRSSKTHGQDNKPQIVTITRFHRSHDIENMRDKRYCPFDLIREYVKMRRKYVNAGESFFVFYDRKPVTPYNMRTVLKTLLEEIGLDYSMYRTHSMRIGRSVDLLRCGVSVLEIRKLGRWRTNVVYKYLSW